MQAFPLFPAASAPLFAPTGPMLARGTRNMLWQAGIEGFGMIRINGKRLLADLREMATIGAYKTGVDRVALSPEDIAARRWLVGKLEAAGLTASMDRIGNVLGTDRRASRAILIGSHTDTVPKGGWLDGVEPCGCIERDHFARHRMRRVFDHAPVDRNPAARDVILGLAA